MHIHMLAVIASKTTGNKKRLVMGWNKRINGKSRITRGINIGNMESLARIVTGHMDAYSLSFGANASILLMERYI